MPEVSTGTSIRKVKRPGALCLGGFVLVCALFLLGTPDVASAASSSGPVFDSTQAMAHIYTLATEIGPRRGGTTAELQAAQYGLAYLSSLGYQATMTAVPIPNGLTSHNVIAVKQGSSPLTIVVGGHIDSKLPSPGGNDNGSGSAAVLELARVLRDADIVPTVVFVLFGNEEMIDSNADHHHYGSRRYVAQMTAVDRSNLVGMISLDMIARGTTFTVRTMGKGPGELLSQLQSYAGATGVGLTYLQDGSTYGYSDHEPFELAGYPAVWLEWRSDPNYHTANDTYANCTAARLQTAGAFVLGYLADLGSGDLADLQAAVNPTLARHQQDNSRLLYTGTWGTSPISSASGGSFRYSDSSGSSVTVRFTGTYLAWIAKKSPVYGIARVILDGVDKGTVDLYSAGALYQQKVWETGILTNTTHTVRIEWTGTKRSAATATNIGVDAFDVRGVLEQAAATIRYEQNNTSLAYLSTWYGNSSAPSASGGSFRYSNVSGASVTVKFTGSCLAWIAKKGPAYGIARVTLDGVDKGAVDLYSASDAYKQKVWESGALANGTHTVTIEWTGEKNTSATGTYIGADAFDVVGTLNQALTRYEQSNAQLTYLGTWANNVSSSYASAGTFRYSNAPGAFVTVKFTGTYLAWITKTSPAYGIARVTLDGTDMGTVDLYSAGDVWQQKVWESGPLASGSHILTIQWTGEKNTSASASNIGTDAFDIVGILTQAPIPIRYQQTSAKLVYAGAWYYNNAAASASGGSFKYTNASGASVTVNFTGTYLAWITKTSPAYGIARVTLDGTDMGTVDLYSAGEVWQQKVWESGLLTSGAHTLLIEWTGEKNPSASADNIGVDAFDVVGTLN
jgi:Peptidase family M28